MIVKNRGLDYFLKQFDKSMDTDEIKTILNQVTKFFLKYQNFSILDGKNSCCRAKKESKKYLRVFFTLKIYIIDLDLDSYMNIIIDIYKNVKISTKKNLEELFNAADVFKIN